MKRWISLSIVFLFLFPAVVSAHPGTTSADGCHVCRTNCDRWGVTRGVRHCHNLESEPAPAPEIVTETKKKNNIPAKVKAFGWEYGLKIQKTNTLTPIERENQPSAGI